VNDMTKTLRGLSHSRKFMEQDDLRLRELFGPIKGDKMSYKGKMWTINKCTMSNSETGMYDYNILASDDAQTLKVRIPVEDLTKNGWSWYVGKFPYELEIDEAPGLFHVVDPFYQNTFDVRAIDGKVATAKAQALFQSDSSHFIVHKIFNIKVIPSASKMVCQLRRAIASVPYDSGPFSDAACHPEEVPTIGSSNTERDLTILQDALENAFGEFYGSIVWQTLGDGVPHSTEDFHILEMPAITDAGI